MLSPDQVWPEHQPRSHPSVPAFAITQYRNYHRCEAKSYYTVVLNQIHSAPIDPRMSLSPIPSKWVLGQAPRQVEKQQPRDFRDVSMVWSRRFGDANCNNLNLESFTNEMARFWLHGKTGGGRCNKLITKQTRCDECDATRRLQITKLSELT